MLSSMQLFSSSRSNKTLSGHSFGHKSELDLLLLNVQQVDFDLNTLPDEVLVDVFTFLPVRDRIRLRSVCRRWSRLTLLYLPHLFVGRVFKKQSKTAIPEFYQLHLTRFLNTNCTTRLLLEHAGRSLRQVHLHRVEFDVSTNQINQMFPLDEPIEEHQPAQFPFLENDFVAAEQQQPVQLNLPEQGFQEPKSLHNTVAYTMMLHCPNLISLEFSRCRGLTADMLRKMLEYYGPQLKELMLRQTHSSNEFQLILDNLDPQRLRKLGLFVENDQQLSTVCRRFPLIEEMYLGSFNPINLEPLETMRKLQVFRFQNRYSQLERLFPLTQGSLPTTLQSLHLNCLIRDSVNHMAFLGCLSNLRHLKMVVNDNRQADYLFDNMNKLESLDLCLLLFPNEFCLENLHKMQNLLSLRIKCHNISSLKLNQQHLMPNVQSLTLVGSNFIYTLLDIGHSLNRLVHIFPNLKFLEITDQWSLPKSLIKCICDLRQLRELRLYMNEKHLVFARESLRPFLSRIHITLVLCTRQYQSMSGFTLGSRYYNLIPRSHLVLNDC